MSFIWVTWSFVLLHQPQLLLYIDRVHVAALESYVYEVRGVGSIVGGLHLGLNTPIACLLVGVLRCILRLGIRAAFQPSMLQFLL